jgi:hypothetical protein
LWLIFPTSMRKSTLLFKPLILTPSIFLFWEGIRIASHYCKKKEVNAMIKNKFTGLNLIFGAILLGIIIFTFAFSSSHFKGYISLAMRNGFIVLYILPLLIIAFFTSFLLWGAKQVKNQ